MGKLYGIRIRSGDLFSKPYIERHSHRLPNYTQRQENGQVIGSGEVESTIKRIGLRMKISGAQWNRENVNPMLRLRCAYLNRELA
ncbi:serine/threonine protein kinase [Geitlerinema sp. FC II]|nr:serine/threonine protein kinase [Geitlerinema sp. FC II]